MPKTNMTAESDYGWLNGEAKPSHAYIAEPIKDILLDLGAKKVLDFGCGNGVLANWLHLGGFDITACDMDETGLQIAAASKSGAKFQRVGIYDPPESLGDSNFDVIVSTEVIEHLFSPSVLLTFARSVLKPGGHLVLSTPYHGWIKNVLISMTGKWDSHHTPLWEGGHIKFFSYHTLSMLLEENGFTVTKFIGVGRCCGLWKSMILVARASDVD